MGAPASGCFIVGPSPLSPGPRFVNRCPTAGTFKRSRPAQGSARRPTAGDGRVMSRAARERLSGALAADQFPVALDRELAAVMHEETTGAAELVGLHRQHLDGPFLVGQGGAGKLE